MSKLSLFTLLSLTLGCGNVVAQSPGALKLVAEVPAPFATVPQTVVQDHQGKPYYYLAAKSGGLQVFDIQDISMPQLIKTVGINQLEGLEVSDVFQRGNLLYLALGNFFGNDTQHPGLAILDVTTPDNPVLRDVWYAPVASKGSGFVTVDGDFAYLGAMAHGFFILNVSDPDAIDPVSQTIPDPDFPLPNPTGAQVPRVRGMAVRGNMLYVCYDAGGLRVYNTADKAHPFEIGHYVNPGDLNKQQAFNNICLSGNLAYVAVDYCGMEVLDISDPANIQQKGWWNPWSCELPSNAWVGSPGHTNQIALDSLRRLVYLSSAQSELSVIDVTQPASPQWVGGYGNTTNNQGTWGVTLAGSRVYLTYILSVIPFASNWAGVRILEPEVSGITAIQDSGWKVFPNPFIDELTLWTGEPAGSLTLEMTDLAGKTLARWQGEATGGICRLNSCGNLPPGSYFLCCRQAGRRVVWKVFKTAVAGQ